MTLDGFHPPSRWVNGDVVLFVSDVGHPRMPTDAHDRTPEFGA